MSLFQLFVSIFFSKNFFCKSFQELPLVVLQRQQKIVFFQKRISTTIWGLNKNLVKFKSTSILFYFLLLTSNLLPQLSFSQETTKPKIGLVLSGGGAKGFAHIGVLKEIEKAGIKIDYIGGTSMGAIVGGLYAAGYNAAQLDSIFKDTDFDALIKDYVPRNNKTFYEKNNDEIYALTLPFQNLKISVPKGLSKGLYNYNLISKLTHSVRHVRDFSKLKIPFLCIGTDVETGEEVVFKTGSLPLALLASSAFPSLFSPVEIDGKVYIDGGVANNYPIEEVIKMGANIIIGVDVQDGLKNRDQLNGATGVLVQISNYQMIERMKEKKKLTTIYIKPDVEQYSVISFSDGEAIIKKGEEAASAFKQDFEKLSTNYTNNPKKLNITDSIYLKSTVITGIKDYTRSYVLGKLRFSPGEKISYNDLHSGINNLNATQNFSAINYNLSKANEQDILQIQLKENPIKTFLKFSLHYNDLFKTGALINITKRKLFFKNDVASFDLILGDNFRYNFDYYIDNGFHWSVGIKSKLNRFDTNSKSDFNDGKTIKSLNLKTININYSDISNQIYVQTIFRQKFLFGVGAEHKYLKIFSSSIQNSSKYIENSDYISLISFLKYDSFDNKYFPRKGWYIFGDTQTYLSSSNFTKNFNRFTNISGDAAFVQTFFKKIAVKVQSEVGFVLGENGNNIFDYTLGGYGFSRLSYIKPFLGYNYLHLYGDSYVKGSLVFDYEIFKKNHINFTANYANIGTNIFDSKNWISSPKFSGYGFGYGIETLLGPIEVKHSWSPETREHYTWFTVGFHF